MTIEQLKEQKAALKEQWERKAHLWNSIVTTKWFFHDEGDTAMCEKMEAKAQKVWAEYEALLAQWDAVELQLIALERAAMNPDVTVSEVPAGNDRSVKLETGWHTLPNGHKLYEHNQVARDDDAQYLSWMKEAVEEALQEDERQNG